MTIPRSGYRFVPIDNRIVKPPVSFEKLHRGQPHTDGSISGILEVEWEAETPVCIGVADGRGKVSPLEIGRRGVLPGSSLRGMLRTVMEIATFSHLGRINDHRHFGYREFATPPAPPANAIKAGWLRYCGQKDKWTLTVAAVAGRIYPVPFAAVLNHINSALDPDTWRSMSAHQKRELFSAQAACGQPNLLCSVKFRAGSDYYEHEGTNNKWGQFNIHAAGGTIRSGYLIVGGAAITTGRPTDRQNEVFICKPSRNPNDEHILNDDFMKLFNRVNSNPGHKVWPEPTGLWRYWLGQMGYNQFYTQRGSAGHRDPPRRVTGCSFPGIPVFFHGTPGCSSFVMGLSRVIKIPYKRGVSDVAARLYDTDTHCFQHGYPMYRVPKLRESFDFARAIFGWIEKREDKPAAAETEEDKPATAETEIEALAGRVAFSPAFTRETPSYEFRTLVFGAPRESFYRFYLVDGSYEDGNGRPAGRKRYPVRPVCQAGGSLNTCDTPTNTQTTVKFHNAGTVYRGHIRVHNLHPVELGALVWCLGFGKVNGPWRHSIGRGKGHGYGCLKLKSLKWRPASLRTANLDKCNVPGGLTDSAQHTDFDALSECFVAHMAKELRLEDVQAFLQHDTITKLRAYANPANGERYASPLDGETEARLDYPSVESFRVIPDPLGNGENWNPFS